MVITRSWQEGCTEFLIIYSERYITDLKSNDWIKQLPSAACVYAFLGQWWMNIDNAFITGKHIHHRETSTSKYISNMLKLSLQMCALSSRFLLIGNFRPIYCSLFFPWHTLRKEVPRRHNEPSVLNTRQSRGNESCGGRRTENPAWPPQFQDRKLMGQCVEKPRVYSGEWSP